MRNPIKFALATAISLSPNFMFSQTTCLNSDFEASAASAITTNTQISGWVCTSAPHGNGSNNCDMSTCCNGNPQTSMLISAAAGHTDAVIGSVYPIYSIFGSSVADANAAVVNPQINFTMKGSNFIRLNSTSTAARLERVSKTFTVSQTNFILDVAFISVLSRGHDCCGATMFKATINSFTCPLIFASGAALGSCTDANKGITFYATQSGTLAGANNFMIFSKWDVRRIDLSAYIGQTVTVNFTSSACASGGHFGYAYLDTQCETAALSVNTNTVPLNAGTTSISACGGNATITAPPYFESYQWQGPQGFSSTAAAIVTSVIGTYTLNLSDSLSCNPASHTIVVMPVPTLSISTSKATSCAGNPVTLTASGVSSFTWQNGVNNASISVSPTITSTYTLTGKDVFGCNVTQSITQNVTACTGLSDTYIDDESVKIFPNPNRNEFILMISSVERAELILENSLGSKIYQQEITKGENRILTTGMSAGIYYYKIVAGEKELKRGKLKFE